MEILREPLSETEKNELKSWIFETCEKRNKNGQLFCPDEFLEGFCAAIAIIFDGESIHDELWDCLVLNK